MLKKSMLSLLAIIMLLVLSISVNTANMVQAAGTVTVYPTENTAILKNPDRGMMTYFSNDYSSVLGIAGLGYRRLDWSALEPSEGNFNWKALDEFIDICQKNGMKLGFGIMASHINSSSSGIQSTPVWVFNAGCKYTTEKVNGSYIKVPVWNDAVYKAKIQNLINAIKARYDNNEWVAYYEIRSYGNWGEWNLANLPNSTPIDDTAKQALINQFSNVSKQLMQVCGETGGDGSIPDYVNYSMNKLKAGIRRDGCVNPDRPNEHVALAYCYDKAPGAAEWWYKYTDLKKKGKWSKIQYEKVIKEGKPTYYGLSCWDDDVFYSEQKDLVDRWANRVGYWLKVVEATFPSDIGNGSTGTITFRVKNDGVAPCYVNKNNTYVKLALLDSGNNVISTTILSGVNPYNWKPGQYKTESANFSFPYKPNAAKLAIGVFSKSSLSNPDIKLGINGATPTGWYVLSDMPKSEDNIAANKIYKASKVWADNSWGHREPWYAFDGNTFSRWVADGGVNDWLEVDFGANKTFNKCTLSECVARISGFRIEYFNGSSWQTAYTGKDIGMGVRTFTFPPVTGTKVRLYVTSTNGWPDIGEFGIYSTPAVPTLGQVLWLKADTIKGITNGGTVNVWQDSSAAKNDAIQNTGTKQPKFYSNVVNGKPTLSFDGVDDYLDMGTKDSLTLCNNVTVFTVAKSSSPAWNVLFGRGEAMRMVNTDSTTCFMVRNTSSNLQYVKGYTQSGRWNVSCGIYSSSNGNLSHLVNGIFAGKSYLGGQIRNNQSDDQPSTVGAAMSWHSDGKKYVDNFFKGDIAEVIMYNRVLPDSERDQVINFLKGKYGIN